MAKYIRRVKGVRVGRRGRIQMYRGGVRMKSVDVRLIVQRRM